MTDRDGLTIIGERGPEAPPEPDEPLTAEEIVDDIDITYCPFTPRHGFVIGVEVRIREIKKGSIIVPEGGIPGAVKFVRMLVLAKGPGRQNEFLTEAKEGGTGFAPIPMDDIQVGDQVYISEYGDQRITYAGDEFIVAEDRSIVAVINAETEGEE